MNFSFLGGSSLSQLVIPESQDESVSTLSNETQNSTINSSSSVITSINNDDLRVSSLKKITTTTLTSQHARPSNIIKTGIPELDQCLLQTSPYGNGIYEIYGPPGIGKSTIAYNILIHYQKDTSKECLWIDTLKTAPFPMKNKKIRLSSITQLQMFFQKKMQSEKYSMIIIDGFSKLVVQYLNNHIFKHEMYSSTNSSQTHQLKVNALQTLFVQFSKYADYNNCKILLVNDCMNTSFKYNPNMHNNSSSNYQFVDENNPFLVVKRQNDSCMLLKSELEASIGIGSLDQKWMRFIKLRIALYYSFEDINTNKTKNTHCINCKVSKNKHGIKSEFDTKLLQFKLPEDYTYFNKECLNVERPQPETADSQGQVQPTVPILPMEDISVLAASSQFDMDDDNVVILESQV